jgi:hypothetical protein
LIDFLKSPGAFIAGMLITVAILITLGMFKSEPSLPIQESHFAEAPMVIVCSDSQYSTAEIESALLYWESLDYEFFSVVYDFDCFSDAAAYSIMISAAGKDFNEGATDGLHRFGKTRISYSSETREIRHSRIEILVSEERVLEHEIGHALGWTHSEKEGHMMHPILSRGGWDSSGLEFVSEE